VSDEVGERERLEATIDAGPDDPSRYAVYGDWLAQRGEARGELIALQLLPSLTRAQKDRVAALQYHPEIRCLSGPLAQWRWGFVHTTTLMRSRGYDLSVLLKHASMRFLRQLVLAQEPLALSLEQLAGAAPRVLDALSLSASGELDLSGVPASLGTLRRLSLSMPELRGRLPALPRLEALELSFLEWRGQTAAALEGPPVDQVHTVTLTGVDTIALPLLDAVLRLPKLTRLTLAAKDTQTDAIDVLENSPAKERLTHLDLSRSGLSERAARRVLALSKQMPSLSDLVLGDPAYP
jgi:uncharacterized protein (TIGR02996 family)